MKTIPVGIHELDLWLFKGFGGLASAIYNRAKSEIPFCPKALEVLKETIPVLKDAVEEYSKLPVGEITPEKFDLALALRFKALVDMIYDRAGLGAQVKSSSAGAILQTEAARWTDQLIPGLEEFNRRYLK